MHFTNLHVITVVFFTFLRCLSIISVVTASTACTNSASCLLFSAGVGNYFCSWPLWAGRI